MTNAVRNLAVRISVTEGGKVKAELREIGNDGEKSLKKITLAGQPASKSLLALNAAANDVRGSIGSMASRMGPLGSALTALGPAGLAAGAALGVLTVGLKSSLEHAAEAERSQNKLIAVLKATGNTSGLTAKQIIEFSDEMEAATLATAEEVQDAATVLTRFTSITGENFKTTIRLAQDLGATMGGDLQSRVLMLGKALEDPAERMALLNRAGVQLTDSQKELIERFAETGEQAKAQAIILDALKTSVGGTGAAEATGVTGAANRLSDAWGNMLENIGMTRPVAGGAAGALNGLAWAVEGLRDAFAEDPLDEQIGDAQKKLQEAQRVLDNFRKTQESSPFSMLGNVIARQEDRVDDLKTELDALLKKGQDEISAQAQAQAAAQKAARDRTASLVADQNKKLTDEIEKLSTDPADKIAKVNRELETTKTRLDALREKDGSNTGAVDAAIAQAETLAKKQIEAIEKPALEAATRAAQSNKKVVDDLQKQISNMGNARQTFIDQAVGRLSDEAGAAQRAQAEKLAAQLFDSQAFKEAQKVVEDLNSQLNTLTDERSKFISGAVSRLSDNATAGQRAEVEKLAAALYDQGKAQERLNKLKQEGEQITNATRTATESYAAEIAKLKELLDAGAISQEVYNRAVADAEKKQLAARTDAQAGAIRAFNAYRESGQDAASSVEKAFTEAMGATEDAIVNLVTSGGASLQSLGDLANSIVAEITRMAVKQAITGPLFNAIGGSMGGGGGGGFLDSIFSMIFHEGGVVGSGIAKGRSVPAHVFIGAPRYHSGGIAGLKPGEIPAILERGETILPKNQKMGGGSTVIMNISTPDANSFRSSQAQIAADAARGIDRARRNL